VRYYAAPTPPERAAPRGGGGGPPKKKKPRLGAAVNVVPKRAPNIPLNQVTAGVRSVESLTWRVIFARRSEDGRFRLAPENMARRDGETA